MTDLLDRWGAACLPRDEFLNVSSPATPISSALPFRRRRGSPRAGARVGRSTPTCISAVVGSPIMADHVVVTRDLMDGSRFRSAVPGVVIVRWSMP